MFYKYCSYYTTTIQLPYTLVQQSVATNTLMEHSHDNKILNIMLWLHFEIHAATNEANTQLQHVLGWMYVARENTDEFAEFHSNC